MQKKTKTNIIVEPEAIEVVEIVERVEKNATQKENNTEEQGVEKTTQQKDTEDLQNIIKRQEKLINSMQEMLGVDDKTEEKNVENVEKVLENVETNQEIIITYTCTNFYYKERT